MASVSEKMLAHGKTHLAHEKTRVHPDSGVDSDTDADTDTDILILIILIY